MYAQVATYVMRMAPELKIQMQSQLPNLMELVRRFQILKTSKKECQYNAVLQLQIGFYMLKNAAENIERAWISARCK